MQYPQLEKAMSRDDLEHKCEDFVELRERKKETGTAYGFQCQFCGEFRGGEVSKKKVLERPNWYDPELETAYWNKIKTINTKSSELLKNNLGLSLFTFNDHSSELHKVISAYCEENNIDTNTVIKSLLSKQRSKHIAEVFQSNWESEQQLHNWLENNLSEYFEIYREVNGNGFLNRDKRNIRIDFILLAKPELINHGFTDQYIGVEVKYFNPKEGKGFHGKSSAGVFQALSYWYSGARWMIPHKGEVELATVLMFSNLSFEDEAQVLFNTMDSHFKKVWKAYLSVANHANVGELLVKTRDNNLSSWSMEYNGSKYYSMNYKGEYVKGNHNVINKRRIGNSK